MDAHICAMAKKIEIQPSEKQLAASDYINLIRAKFPKQDGSPMPGNALAKKIGVTAGTINKAIGGNPIESSTSLKTLYELRKWSGVPFTPALVAAYDLPEETSFEVARRMGGDPERQMKAGAAPLAAPVWIDEIESLPLRDDTVLLQFWDASGVRFRVKVAIETVYRLRDKWRDY